MRSKRVWWTLLTCALLAMPAAAQNADQQEEGVTYGGYHVRQSFEIGGRLADFDGSSSLWHTFVNLRDGVRLLEQHLDMRSVDRNGLLFDSLTLSSFGYGGDPNAASRLRMAKGKWYKFAASFRRDHNFWDYNLLANPLNPSTSNPNIPVLDSPHRYDVVRRMTDINLTLAPLSPVRVRLGYNHNVHEGPSFSSFHEGTEALTFQNWRNNLYSYQIGVDFRVLPRTNFSYDQFFQRFKGDTAWNLADRPFLIAPGVPADLGLPFNTAANQPCSTTTFNTNPGTCNGYLDYSRHNRVRTSYPTEQFSLQSSYWKKVDIAGRLLYSGAETTVPDAVVDEFDGLATRTRLRQFVMSGPVLVKRVSVSADLGVTFHVTDKFRIVESFRWADFRLPGQWDMAEAAFFSTSMLIAPNVYSAATCPAPFNGAGCPQHTTSSGADLASENFVRFLGQDSKINTIDLEYDFTRRVGARLGWRYRNRDIQLKNFDTATLVYFPTLAARGSCAAGNAGGFTPDPVTGICTTTSVTDETHLFEINEHSALLGFWTRPTDQWRISFDLELMSADHVFTRVSPRNLQRYKLRATYKPKDWVNIGGAINILEQRNTPDDVNNKQHYRFYAWNVTLMPNDRWGVDVSYNYNDVFSQTNICLVATPPPTPGLPSCGGSFLQELSFYEDDNHFFSGSFMWKPVRRVTTNIGYTVTSSTGATLLTAPTQPLGSLNFNWHQPMAMVAIELAPRWTWKTAWNHYGYNEKGVVGPTAPRDFRGNVFTLSLRYGF